MARNKRLRVILKPAFYILDANGQRVQIPGRTIEFMNGRFESEDPEIIAGMLKHDYCNLRFTPVDNEKEWIADHPAYFRPAVEMVTGAVATINTAPAPLAEQARTHLRQEVALHPNKTDPVVDLDSIINEKLDAKFAALTDQLLAKLSISEAVKAEIPKAKKVFTCPVPGCGYIAKSGVELGTHKKETHTSAE